MAILGKDTGHIGSWGTRDFGFTEALAGLFGKPKTPQGGSNLDNSKQKSKAETKTTKTPPPPGGGGGGGQSSQGITNSSTYQPSYDIESDIEGQKNEEEDRYNQFVSEQRNAINAEFEPVFAELDRRIGLLPEQRAEYEKQIAEMAVSQKAGVTSDQESNIAKLSQSQEKEKETAASSFRDLESDIRNQLLSRSIYFGAAGAGDSSAPGVASEAIARGGLKARSTIMKARNEALTQLETKKADVNTLASEQSRKIEEWKSNKVFETVQFFTNKLDELNSQKTNATVEKARSINELIRGAHQDFLGRLRQLDDTVTNFKSSVETWKMQRAAELEDYQKKLAMSAAYSSSTGNTQQAALNNFAKLYGTGGLSLGQAAQLSGQDLSGLELTDEDLGRRKSPLEEQLLGAVAQMQN